MLRKTVTQSRTKSSRRRPRKLVVILAGAAAVAVLTGFGSMIGVGGISVASAENLPGMPGHRHHRPSAHRHGPHPRAVAPTTTASSTPTATPSEPANAPITAWEQNPWSPGGVGVTSPGGPATAPATANPPAVDNRAQVITAVNAERAKAGCAAVTENAALDTSAQGHSADMAARNYFAHESLGGGPFSDRITAAGYTWSTVGENIAMGQQSPGEVMEAWMNSSGHRTNILDCAFRDIGVGVAADASGSLYWTQDFASPRR